MSSRTVTTPGPTASGPTASSRTATGPQQPDPGVPHWSAGLAMGCLGMLSFSGTLPATRLAVPAFGPIVLTGARIEIGALMAVVTLTMIGWRLPAPRLWPGILVMGACTAVGYPLFVGLAMENAPAAHGSVVIGLAPAATAVAAVLRAGERPPRIFWAGCGVGVATVLAFAVHQGGFSLTPADGWLLLALMSLAVAYTEGGRVSREIGGLAAFCWCMIAMAPVVALPLGVALARHDWSGPIPAAAWAGFWYAGIVSMFLGSVAWYRGLAAGGIARIGQLNLFLPLLSLGWASLFLGEHVSVFAIGCAIVIIGAMAVCIRSRVAMRPAVVTGGESRP